MLVRAGARRAHHHLPARLPHLHGGAGTAQGRRCGRTAAIRAAAPDALRGRRRRLPRALTRSRRSAGCRPAEGRTWRRGRAGTSTRERRRCTPLRCGAGGVGPRCQGRGAGREARGRHIDSSRSPLCLSSASSSASSRGLPARRRRARAGAAAPDTPLLPMPPPLLLPLASASNTFATASATYATTPLLLCCYSGYRGRGVAAAHPRAAARAGRAPPWRAIRRCRSTARRLATGAACYRQAAATGATQL